MVALSCCLWTLKTFARWQLRTAYSGSRLAVFYHMDACAWGHGMGGICVSKALQLDSSVGAVGGLRVATVVILDGDA